MSDDPFYQIMRDRGLGEAETTEDEVVSPSLPLDYAARVRALELACVHVSDREAHQVISGAQMFLDFLMGLEKV